MKTNIFTLWMTGIPCSGKTTIAIALKKRINNIVVLDGDEMRKGINSDLGFSINDREENARRISHMAKHLNDNGISVIVSTISPTNKIRGNAKNIIGNYFKLCYVKCDSSVCMKRDVKGMYASKTNFTGKDSPYEEPLSYDVMVDTESLSPNECVINIENILII